MPVERLRAAGGYQDLLARVRKRRRGTLHWGGFWGSSKACMTAALATDLGSPLLVVVPDSSAGELALDDFATLGAGAIPLPAREGRLGAEAAVMRERYQAMERMHRDGFTGVVVAPLAALLQPAPPADGDEQVLEIAEGMSVDPETLLRRLVDADFERVPAISNAGEVALRGDILDFFAPSTGEPLRLEFFDDELESIRIFDVGSQRTRHVLRHAKVPLAQDLPEVAGVDDRLPLEDVPSAVRVVRWEPALLDEAAAHLALQNAAFRDAHQRLDKLLAKRLVLDLATLPGRDGTLDVLSVEEYCRGVADGVQLLEQRAGEGEHVVLCCSTTAEADRARHLLEEASLDPNALHYREGGLERGFRVPEARLTVVHHRELIPGHGAARPRPRHRQRHETATVESALSLRPGDLVVHAIHGLARFQGIEIAAPSPEAGAATSDAEQDVLVLEFAKGGLLHVPASRVDLVERYVGSGGASPPLDRLGSGAFERRRRKVAAAVEDLAAEMIESQARRLTHPGTAFPDSEDQATFDAGFPWEDTPDQAQGAREIGRDQAEPRPMDRLLCGDVGYGKTELAARAAFRVLNQGAQVAVLVPTTVLAEQHARTFRERFAPWPVNIAQLSRVRPPAERRETLKGLAEGRIDLVVGTHRLLSSDVRFRDLGLVIIDEEQRFGVRAKNQLRKKRNLVDVLVLSATPIPRTLHMAMAGIRDITSLSTPPPGRLEVHTEIRYRDEEGLIQESLRREIARGGQAFFVHNRVRSLESVANKLRRLVPEATIVTGHGQMEPRELERVMLSFVRGEAQVLCSTTIVESGLDIPTANTIFIDSAQNYGLADLHQLRGRVGRATHRGYCYLLIPKGQPLSKEARHRLKAVEELRYLGAGFQIALRDLEIRGAGNLLGPEQSGHIAAVGYETYRRLLAQAVARLKRRGAGTADGKSPARVADLRIGVRAALRPEYVPDEESRLQILREFDRVRTEAERHAALDAVRDRFGPPPEEVVRLSKLFFLKHCLGGMGLDSAQWVDDRLICSVREMKRLERALRKQGVDLRVITARQAHWVPPPEIREPDAILEHLLEIANACAGPRKRGQSHTRVAR